jgi:hypothetical protein
MRSDRLRLQDILDAIAVVRLYLPADRTAFDSDLPSQSHILRDARDENPSHFNDSGVS